MNEKVAVIAGNHRQYICFLRENALKHKDYFYVSGLETLRGCRRFRYITYGTYYERKDFGEIYQQLLLSEAVKETPDE